MMRIALSAMATLTAMPVHAGGVAPSPAPAPIVMPDTAPDWTGFYAGLQIELIQEAQNFDPADRLVIGFEGHLAGIFLGYRHDLGDLVVGGEIDYVSGVYNWNELGFGVPAVAAGDADVTLLRVGAEVGYDLGPALAYGTVGFARIRPDSTSFTANGDEGDGYFIGAGLDFRLTDHVVIGTEILFHDFDELERNGYSHTLTTVGLNVALTF